MCSNGIQIVGSTQEFSRTKNNFICFVEIIISVFRKISCSSNHNPKGEDCPFMSIDTICVLIHFIFGFKAKMLGHDQTAEMCGHAVGGVCPFAVKEGVEVYLDACGNRYDYGFGLEKLQ